MDSFIKKYLGRVVDYDGLFNFQCVDLIKVYLHEKFGLRPKSWGNAIDYWKKTHPEVLKRFVKVTGSSAKKGDIVILNGLSGNPYGHIGIATGAINSKQVEILEQNGSTGNGKGTGGDRIRKRFVDRNRVAGLLRPKSTTTAKVVATVSSYVVRAGDYMSKIAKSLGVPLASLIKANPQVKNPNLIYKGQKLNVPAKSTPKPAPKKYHTVVRGDTVSKICKKYGISTATFKKLNPSVKNINLIHPGQKFRVK